ncbi:hypothetical protein [Cryobacterium tagatosivorans]|jgi:hypothetical protein|uniref:Uncharacterized protein n=1 Tax=Cryobacterium tagatosivorans TaxID=1259199 RepID=A0A4R8UE63_9MICO|nr:hypothetical protein [Cryobacterium tagatosivorans]TFB48980.1 hypothetical protein E3O23_12220 [Cryobacterium tagatosivorans]
MRKYIFNGAMLGVIMGGWSIFQATRNGPRDWRLVLMWLGWALSAVAAIDTVVEQARAHKIEA